MYLLWFLFCFHQILQTNFSHAMILKKQISSVTGDLLEMPVQDLIPLTQCFRNCGTVIPRGPKQLTRSTTALIFGIPIESVTYECYFYF
jgi:hypothetical protein